MIRIRIVAPGVPGVHQNVMSAWVDNVVYDRNVVIMMPLLHLVLLKKNSSSRELAFHRLCALVVVGKQSVQLQ